MPGNGRFVAGRGIHAPQQRPVHGASVVRLSRRRAEGRSGRDIDRLSVAGHGHLLGLHPPFEMLLPADRAVLAHADQSAFAFLDRPEDHDIGVGRGIDRAHVHHVAPHAAPTAGAIGRAVGRIAALSDAGHITQRELRSNQSVIAILVRLDPPAVLIAAVPGYRLLGRLGTSELPHRDVILVEHVDAHAARPAAPGKGSSRPRQASGRRGAGA